MTEILLSKKIFSTKILWFILTIQHSVLEEILYLKWNRRVLS